MRIVLLGPPGAGKGTQAATLVESLRIPHLSSGDMLRAVRQAGGPMAEQIQQYLASGQLVPDSLVLEIIAKRLQQGDCRGGCLFDGFPRTRPQAEALDNLLLQSQTPLDLVLEISVDPQRLVQRLALRGREDDQPDVVRNRLEVYRQQTAPLLAYYRQRGILQTIDGNGPPDEVASEIRRSVEGFVPPGT